MKKYGTFLSNNTRHIKAAYHRPHLSCLLKYRVVVPDDVERGDFRPCQVYSQPFCRCYYRFSAANIHHVTDCSRPETPEQGAIAARFIATAKVPV